MGIAGAAVIEFITLRAQVRRPEYWMITVGLGGAAALLSLAHIREGTVMAIAAFALWGCLALWVGRLNDAGKSWARLLIPLAASGAIIAIALALLPIVLFGAVLAMVLHYLDLAALMNVTLWLAAAPFAAFGVWLGLVPTAKSRP